MPVYTISRTTDATLRRLAQMAATARQPATPTRTRDAAAMCDARAADARARDNHERFVACDNLRRMNYQARRFWDSAGERGLMGGLKSEDPPSAFAQPRYGAANGGQHNVGVGSLGSVIAGARSGSDTLAHSTPFDPVGDLGRRGSGAPMGDLPLASMNATNAHHWGLPQEKRSDFLAAVRQAHVNGLDVSPDGIARLAAMFK